MGCSECEKAQKEIEYVSYVRVSNGNVMLVGCKEHIRQLLHSYNFGIIAEKEENTRRGLA